MMTAHLERFHFAPPPLSLHRLHVRELLRRVLVWARQTLCGIRGHSMLLHYEPDRLSLQCFACGATSGGWTLEVRPEFRHDAHPRVRVLRRIAAASRAA